MPELPDIDVYIDALRDRVKGSTLKTVRVSKPFLVRSFDPPLSEADGHRVSDIRRLGKRIVIGLEPDLWLVLHLMVAGRLQWHDDAVSIRGKHQLAAFDFETGTLLLTEAGSKKRASLYLVRGEESLADHDPGGLETLECSLIEFKERLTSENRTLKRALTNPRSFSGIGNAYSDEILHTAQLSPVKWTTRLTEDEQQRLFDAVVSTLTRWRSQLQDEAAGRFPSKVTAFRKDMAVHGKYGKPCPVCGTSVARIRYKSNETNYCPTCQTGGKLLADRSLSRLLKDDWPDGV